MVRIAIMVKLNYPNVDKRWHRNKRVKPYTFIETAVYNRNITQINQINARMCLYVHISICRKHLCEIGEVLVDSIFPIAFKHSFALELPFLSKKKK